MIDWSKKFTDSEIQKLMERRKRKIANADSRGISFTLSRDDWLMMGEKLLGRGNCDYCDMPLTTTHVSGEEAPLYPTVERIDDKKGYIRGNVCVVAQRANQLKDNLVDKKIATTIIEPLDREIVRGMLLNMSKEHMEALKIKYLPQTEEKEMDDDQDVPVVNVREASVAVSPKGDQGPQGIRGCGDGTIKKEQKQNVPDDVAVALAYANYCKSFADVGMKVTVTYAQFKAKYIRKVCAMTGEPLSSEPKSVLILDLSIGFAKDNFIIVSKKMETAMTQVMINTGLSLPKITAMLNKVVA